MINKNKKKTGIFLIILALVLLIVLVFIFINPDKSFFKKFLNRDKTYQEKEKTEEDLFNEMIKEEQEKFVYTFNENEEKNREWTEDDFKAIARPFVERFGSYSSHSNYENIEDLNNGSIMTSSMRTWASRYISELRSKNNEDSEFYGVNTQVLLEPEIISLDLDKKRVELLVKTKRSEILGSGNNRTYSQDIKIIFIKEKGEWLINEALWQ